MLNKPFKRRTILGDAARISAGTLALGLASCDTPDGRSSSINPIPADGEKLNFVVILADDVGVEAFENYGGLSYKTPNITKLAENGTTFTRMFSQPLCTPSRVELLTGKANIENYESFGWLVT